MGIEKRNLRRRSDTKMETFGNLKAKKFTKTYFLKSVRQLCYGSTDKKLAIGIVSYTDLACHNSDYKKSKKL